MGAECSGASCDGESEQAWEGVAVNVDAHSDPVYNLDRHGLRAPGQEGSSCCQQLVSSQQLFGRVPPGVSSWCQQQESELTQHKRKRSKQKLELAAAGNLREKTSEYAETTWTDFNSQGVVVRSPDSDDEHCNEHSMVTPVQREIDDMMETFRGKASPRAFGNRKEIEAKSHSLWVPQPRRESKQPLGPTAPP